MAVAATEAPERWSPEPFVTPPEQVLAAADAVELETGGDGVLLLSEETRFSYDADGRETMVRTLVYRLLSPAGVDEWDVVSEVWEPWHEQRPMLRARVIAPDGNAVELDPATISEAPADPGGVDVYDDRLVVQAPLPLVQTGAVVEERVTTVETEPRFPGGAVHRYYPAWVVPTVQTRLVVELPADRDLRFKAYLLDGVEPTLEKVGDRRRWTFEFVPPPEEEDPEQNLPFDEPRYPNLVFSTGASWSEIATAYAGWVDRRIAEGPVDDLGPAAEVEGLSEIDRVAAALGWIRDRVRYTGLEFGESSIAPYPPSQTVARGFGDCKDQATLLVAMLRGWGMDADVALLSAGFYQDIDPDLPGLGGFNHAIVHVAGDPPLWVDPVASYTRAGTLPSSDAGRLALIADPSTRAPVAIPDARSSDNGEVEERRFELADSGASRVESTTEAWGAFERRYRSSYSGSSDEEVRDGLESWVQGAFLAEEVASFEHTDPEDLDGPFRLEVTVDEARRGLTGYDEAQVVVRFDDLIAEFPSALQEETEELREHDFLYPEPFTIEWRYRAVPPVGFEAANLPESRTTALGPASLTEEYRVAEDGAIEAVVKIDSGPRRITAEQFEATRAAMLELEERGWESLYFVHTGERLLKSGETAAGLLELSRLAEAHPDVALHQVRLARGLLEVGLGEEARNAADHAVEVDPTSQAALTTKAWVLQHDLVGRLFGPGFDRAGAIAAYRAAQELEDFELDSWINLAIVLEYDDEGRRYSDGADLDGAIAEYRAAKQANDDFVYDHNLMVALLKAGRLDEIVEGWPELGETSKENIIVLTAVAATVGVDEAVRRARATRDDPETVRSTLVEVGRLLSQQRLYKASSEVFRIASLGAPNAAELLSFSFTMKLARRAEEVEVDRSTPDGTLRAFYVSLAAPDADDTLASSLISRRLTAVLDHDQLSDLGVLSEKLIDSISRRSSVPPAVLVDLALASMEILVDGEAGDLRRVHLRSNIGSGAFDETVFVVREGDVYRVACAEKDISPLGLFALAHLDSDRLDGAREVLDWARELTVSYDSGDPLGGPVLARVWSRDGVRDAATARLAALALAADGALAGTVVEELEAELETADDPARVDNLLLALTKAYLELERWDDLAAVASQLLERHPTSEIALLRACTALGVGDRWDEAERLAAKRLEERPNDATVLRILGNAASMQGDYDRADVLVAKVLGTADALSSDFNERAWLTLFRNAVDERALLWAHSAVQRAGAGSYPALHTLATLYAELDMPAEAYQVIVEAIDENQEPSPADWYVFGRMAETYGFPDAARRSYQRVIDGDDDPNPVSTAALAERRLAVLDLAEGEQDAGDA